MGNWKDHEYQGHRNWHYWNVCLYINNEYSVYLEVNQIVDKYGETDEAARWVHSLLQSIWGSKTPDGANITIGACRAAIEHWAKA